MNGYPSNERLKRPQSVTLVKGLRRDTPLSSGERYARSALTAGVISLLVTVAVPALSLPTAAWSMVRGWRTLKDPDSGIRGSAGLGLGLASGLCGVLFLVLWLSMRPTAGALIRGWAGLRRLPAVEIGFQTNARDPFAIAPESFKLPGAGSENKERRTTTAPTNSY